jgi:hypothetical protein
MWNPREFEGVDEKLRTQGVLYYKMARKEVLDREDCMGGSEARDVR